MEQEQKIPYTAKLINVFLTVMVVMLISVLVAFIIALILTALGFF